MSLVRMQISDHENHRSARSRAVLNIRMLWRDAAERKLEREVLDGLDDEDKLYASALYRLDAEFNEAAKLLGPE